MSLLLNSGRCLLLRPNAHVSSSVVSRGFLSSCLERATPGKNVPSIKSGNVFVAASYRSSLPGRTTLAAPFTSPLRRYSTPVPPAAAAAAATAVPAAAPPPAAPNAFEAAANPAFDVDAVLRQLEQAAGVTSPVVSQQAAEAASEAAAQATAQAAAQAAATSNWYDFAVHGLQWLHETTGMPWWLTIAVSVVGFRLTLLPLAIRSMRNTAKLANLQPQMNAITQRVNEAKARGDPMGAQRAAQEVIKLWQEHNVNPFKSIILMLPQMPFFIAFFFALQKIALIDPSFATGGALWFTNLAVNDPYYRLPIVSAVGFVASIALGADGPQPPQQARMKLFMYGMTPLVIYFSGQFPQGVLWYWAVSTGFSLLQMVVLRSGPVKRAVGIPSMPKLTAATATQDSTMEYFKKHILGLKADAEASKAVVTPAAAPAAASVVAAAAPVASAAAGAKPLDGTKPVYAWPGSISKRKADARKRQK